MTVAVVADAHLSGPGGSASPLIHQLEALPAQGCTRLIFLGDLFHVWIGDRRFETKAIREVVAAVRRLRGAGIEVVYIEGNRDFFLGGSCYADAFDHIAQEVSFVDQGIRYLAIHGDGLNDRDWRYRFWRWLSKSFASRVLVGRIPGSWARAIVERTEKSLARGNFKHKNEIPEAAIKRYGRRRLAQGHDVLLMGHFHEQLSYQLPEGEVRLLVAWFDRREIEWLGNDPATEVGSLETKSVAIP